MRYIRPILILVLVLLASCQTIQDPAKAEALAEKVLALQVQIQAIAENGGEVPPELMTALADLVSQLAVNEDRATALAEEMESLKEDVQLLVSRGEAVPSELTNAISDLAAEIAKEDSGSPPIDVTSIGASAAILLGLYNQMFGSRRSKRLEKQLPA